MSAERALYARLTSDASVAALIGTRLFPNFAPLGTAAPFATYRRISTRPIGGLVERAGFVFARIQIDVFAETYPAVRAAASAIRVSLDRYRGSPGPGLTIEGATWQGDLDIYEDDMVPPLHRVSLDFFIPTREE